jgi:DNA-binding CsgD family transcriptional regulator
MLPGMRRKLTSAEPVFRCDEELRVVDWNRAAEAVTGIPAEDAVGKHCWDAVGGRDGEGRLVCTPACSVARLARQGWPVECRNLVVGAPAHRRRVTISTIVLSDAGGQTILHPVRASEEPPAAASGHEAPRLTRRQLEILGLLAGGVRVREIADRLTLSETTVRNHVRALLLELGAHSQLEAVARARELALVA